jgi:hypothetical protein
MVCSDADNGWSRCKSITNTEALDERDRYNNTILINLKDVCILISINSAIDSLTIRITSVLRDSLTQIIIP